MSKLIMTSTSPIPRSFSGKRDILFIGGDFPCPRKGSGTAECASGYGRRHKTLCVHVDTGDRRAIQRERGAIREFIYLWRGISAVADEGDVRTSKSAPPSVIAMIRHARTADFADNVARMACPSDISFPAQNRAVDNMPTMAIETANSMSVMPDSGTRPVLTTTPVSAR
jgi:hypothetical protein